MTLKENIASMVVRHPEYEIKPTKLHVTQWGFEAVCKRLKVDPKKFDLHQEENGSIYLVAKKGKRRVTVYEETK